MFLIKCLQNNNEDNFNIYDYVKFTSGRTRSSGVKLAINYTRTSSYRHFYFNRIVLIYNAISSVVNLSDSYYTIQCKVVLFLWFFLIRTSIHTIHALITLSVPVIHAILQVFIFRLVYRFINLIIMFLCFSCFWLYMNL